MNKTREIIHYHEETKHHFHRFAKSLGYMDWKNQPNPFRFYENIKMVPLPLLKETPRSNTYFYLLDFFILCLMF